MKRVFNRVGLFAKFLVIAIVLANITLVPNVRAISEEQTKLFNKGIYYFNYNSCQLSFNAIDSSLNVTGDNTIYQSGLRGPYILEQWAIHVLKAIAARQNIDESKTVTQEHVIALLAFAKGEGGDIANQDLFNPLNTGINSPELIDGKHAGNGVQSFKSFDAGVEAAVRTMTGNNQNRTAKTLSDPNSSAGDFMKALTYYQRYKGNYFWAEASKPPAQDSYYQGRLDLVRQVKTNYKDIASVVIGTPELELSAGKRDPSKLTFDSSGAAGDTDSLSAENAAGCSCSVRGSETPSILTGDTNAQQAFNFLVDNGLTPEEAAGAVGNFMLESGGGTENIDPNATNPSGHKGIAQWDTETRWPALLTFAEDHKKEGEGPRSLIMQLRFALQEKQMKDYLSSKPKDPKEAAEKFDSLFEQSGGSALDKRIEYAKSIYQKYGSSGGGASSPQGDDCPDETSGSDGEAFITDGHAWPIDLSKADVSAGYPLPCRQDSCHHDGTPAFDLSHKDTVENGKDSAVVGKAVYAIADGEIAKIGIYQGISGCYAMEFKADDGYVYWYGHIRKPTSQEVGKKFKVGEKVAEVGERKCTGNGSYPHLHIDRGSPKGEFGGSVCCRDPGMNDLINGMYEKLP